MGASKIIICNRTKTKAEELKKTFNELEIIDWGETPNFDMVINATSIGLNTNDKIKNTISTLEKWKFIDICNPMLKAGYDKFYDQDQLHMNDLGYSLLSKSLRDEIAKTK